MFNFYLSIQKGELVTRKTPPNRSHVTIMISQLSINFLFKELIHLRIAECTRLTVSFTALTATDLLFQGNTCGERYEVMVYIQLKQLGNQSLKTIHDCVVCLTDLRFDLILLSCLFHLLLTENSSCQSHQRHPMKEQVQSVHSNQCFCEDL